MNLSDSNAPAAPVALRTEYRTNPIGIDETAPQLYWRVSDSRRGAVQTAYQVLVSRTPASLALDKGDLWDSGKVKSGQNAHVAYAGKKLASRQGVYWKVRTWDHAGQPSPWSQVASWEMGLLGRSDWKGQWIGHGTSGSPCAFFRKSFVSSGKLVRARLYATARGVYELHVNGQRIGEDIFRPGWTDYAKRIQYQAYDVTRFVRDGQNALGAVLGDGWYCGHVAWRTNVYGDKPSVLAQLVLEYADGHTETIVSDGTWKVSTGPILASDMLMGETYDARLEVPGWDTPEFDDTQWVPATVETLAKVPLVAQRGPSVRRIQEIRPTSVTQASPGVYILDLGQNMVGWVRLSVNAPAGTTFTLRHAEVLNPDGSLYLANLRKAKATDVYTSRGGAATYEPHFTFHGFRYVEVTVQPADGVKIDADSVTGIVVHSDTPPTGTFETSHPLINQLQHNIQWGQKGNFLEAPTDCPQRDERLGWTGDIQAFIRTACFNMEVAGFMDKWLTDLMDSQNANGAFPSVAPDVLSDGTRFQPDGGPGWADAGVIVPWTVYQCYGDRRLLERCYPHIVKYIAYLKTCNPLKRHNYADWLHHDAHTPVDLIHWAFYAHSVDLARQAAAALGRKPDAAKFAKLFQGVKKEFIRKFVTADGRVLGDTQTAYTLALRFDLLPKSLRVRAGEHLAFDVEHGRFTNMWKHRQTHISTGFLGVKHLPFALSDIGRMDLAFKLLMNEDYPSWLFPVKNGATTIWERWDGWTKEKGFQDPGMNSFNHYAYGSIGQWMYQVVGGMDMPEGDGAVGYRHILIHPQPGPFTQARTRFESVHGPIESSWQSEGTKFTLSAVIPPGTRATIVLPASSLSRVTEGGQPLKRVAGITASRVEKGHVVLNVGAGNYCFECPLKK